jgi:Ni,Fe-hydrogenase I cytochrome b subunit
MDLNDFAVGMLIIYALWRGIYWAVTGQDMMSRMRSKYWEKDFPHRFWKAGEWE